MVLLKPKTVDDALRKLLNVEISVGISEVIGFRVEDVKMERRVGTS